jgi:hypothetical protein
MAKSLVRRFALCKIQPNLRFNTSCYSSESGLRREFRYDKGLAERVYGEP